MASLVTVRQAVADRLATIPGLHAYRTIPPNVVTPCAVVMPATGTFLTYDTSTGSDDANLVVLLLVSAAEDGLAQDALDAYLAGSGTASIRTVLAGNLGGASGVDYAVVTAADSYGLHTVAGVDYFGCQFSLTVGLAAT